MLEPIMEGVMIVRAYHGGVMIVRAYHGGGDDC